MLEYLLSTPKSPRNDHAEGARINCQSHRDGRNTIGIREQGKYGLSGEEIDKGEKGDVPDQQAARESPE
jgi:hypothetical protein